MIEGRLTLWLHGSRIDDDRVPSYIAGLLRLMLLQRWLMRIYWEMLTERRHRVWNLHVRRVQSVIDDSQDALLLLGLVTHDRTLVILVAMNTINYGIID